MASPPRKIVISASRRTDIPAFYMEDFMAQVNRGYFELTNPYNRKVSTIPTSPENVHTIVFWSKNFGPFIHNRYGEELLSRGYHLFFNFTINSESSMLEPVVPALSRRLEQLEDLCSLFGAKRVIWRFDPICFYRTGDTGSIKHNLKDFPIILDRAAECGISICVTSFMDLYSKIKKRIAALPGFSFVEINVNKKIELILKMEKLLFEKNMDLKVCCEKDLIDRLPPASHVTGSSCIPNELLMEMSGGSLSLKKDYGQRIEDGCGCRTSMDVGNYRLNPCRHNCLYCYANPLSDNDMLKWACDE